MAQEKPPDQSTFMDAFLRETRALVKTYDFSGDVEVSPLSQAENTILLVHDRGRSNKYVLRINSHQLTYHNPAVIGSEMAWLRALREESDVEAPDPVASKDGRYVQRIEAPEIDQRRCAIMMTFLEGVEPDPGSLLDGFERLGEITARMHAHAKGWARPADFVRPDWSPESIANNEQGWGDWRYGYGMEDEGKREVLGRAMDTVLARLARIERDEDRFGLIHADFRLANILLEGDRTKVIDFDDCGFGYYLYDLASALTFIEERPDVPELIETWLAGYRRVAEVPPDVEAEIPSFVMLRRIMLLGYIGNRRHLEYVQELGVGFTTDTLDLVEAYLARYG